MSRLWPAGQSLRSVAGARSSDAGPPRGAVTVPRPAASRCPSGSGFSHRHHVMGACVTDDLTPRAISPSSATSRRHCERSEAIHATHRPPRSARLDRRPDCFVADAPRNDAGRSVSAHPRPRSAAAVAGCRGIARCNGTDPPPTSGAPGNCVAGSRPRAPRLQTGGVPATRSRPAGTRDLMRRRRRRRARPDRTRPAHRGRCCTHTRRGSRG